MSEVKFLNKYELKDILDITYSWMENTNDGNGYTSNHEIKYVYKNYSNVYEIHCWDNQGESWDDTFAFKCIIPNDEFGNNYSLTSDKNNDTVLFNHEKEDYVRLIIKKVLSDTLRYKSDKVLDADVEDVVKRFNHMYTDKAELEAQIAHNKECAEGAYDNYMYEECADYGYDAKASQDAFSRYCDYKNKAEYLESRLNKLTNNQGE